MILTSNGSRKFAVINIIYNSDLFQLLFFCWQRNTRIKFDKCKVWIFSPNPRKIQCFYCKRKWRSMNVESHNVKINESWMDAFNIPPPQVWWLNCQHVDWWRSMLLLRVLKLYIVMKFNPLSQLCNIHR